MASRLRRRIVTSLAALALAAGCATGASAQALRAPSADSVAAGATANRNSLPTPATTGLPGVTAQQSTSTGTGSGSAFHILGMPLRIAAPVQPAYNSQAEYETFAGQPMGGRDAVIQQSIDGSP